MAPQKRVVEGSCWTCRKRRVKCDLIKPKCGRCSSGDVACSYGSIAPVQWIGGTASRGRNAPGNLIQDHEDTSPTAVSSSPTSSDVQCEDVVALSPTKYLEWQHDIDDEAMHSPPISLEWHRDESSELTLSPQISLEWDADGLLMYFSHAVLPRFRIQDGPFPLDVNAISRDPAMRATILAVAQAHHDTFTHATSESSMIGRRRARHSAIQTLRQQLGFDGATKAQDLFPANVLLCVLDGMIDPNEQTNASRYHLKGGHALIQSNADLPASIIRRGGLHAHLLSVFATIDLVHSLLSGEKPYFDPFIWYMFCNTETWYGHLDASDRFLALLKVFSEMAYLGHTVASQLPSDEGFRLIEKCLPLLEAALKQQASCGTSSTLDPAIWTQFCDLYELSATIYLRRALEKRPIDDERVQAATREGVEKLIDGSLPGMVAHCVIFPILVIGAHAVYAQDRRAILQAISPSKDYLSFGNLQVMTDLLRSMWAEESRDMQADWWSCFRPVAGKVFLF